MSKKNSVARRPFDEFVFAEIRAITRHVQSPHERLLLAAELLTRIDCPNAEIVLVLYQEKRALVGRMRRRSFSKAEKRFLAQAERALRDQAREQAASASAPQM